MSKKRKIKKLEARIAELEQAIALHEQAAPKRSAAPNAQTRGQGREGKRPAKNSVNVYFDSNFVKTLTETSEDRLTRRERRDIAYENRARRNDVRRYRKGQKGESKLWKFVKVFFRIIFVLIVIALIAAVLAAIVMAVVWALVNFNIAPLSNPFIAFVWNMITQLFAMFGMPVPTI